MTKGYVYTILSAVIYGCMPLMANYIYMEGVNSLTLVFLRNFLALPILGVLAFLNRKKCNPTQKNIYTSSIPALFGCVLTPILLFSSYNYLDSGVATVFHFVYTALVLILSIIFLRKKPNLITLLGVIICFIGILCFYDSERTLNTTGAILALASGLAFAIYIVILPKFQSTSFNGFTFCFYVSLWSSIMMLIICLSTNKLTLPKTLLGWVLCVVFATLITVGAVVLFQQGSMIIGGVKSSILSALEPTVSVILGIAIFKESSNFNNIIGSVLVITSSILIAVFDFKNNQKEKLKNSN